MTESSTLIDPPSTPMSWRGWGDPARVPILSERIQRVLAREIGGLGPHSTGVSLDQVSLPEPNLDNQVRTELEGLLGREHVSTERLVRIERAGGKSYADLLRRRQGDATGAPDVVVFPADHHQVAALLHLAARHGIAVVPYGGGTSVVGGVEPVRLGFATLISLDLSRMDRLTELDDTSMLATFEPGVRGPAAEAALRERGYTLGHFPQSYAYASIGGYVATRSAGQASTGYGRIDELVHRVVMATPTGTITAGGAPASAAGPDLRNVLVGSEGTLGVITSATLRLHHAPEVEVFDVRAVRNFEEGRAILRGLAQDGMAPAICRLSDSGESRLFANQAEGAAGRAFRSYLRLRGYGDGCLLILGWSGLRRRVALQRAGTARVMSDHRTLRLGPRPGRKWAHGRFDGAYLRDALMDRGVMVETFETATTWGNAGPLYTGVKAAVHAAMSDVGTPGVLACHISHLYQTGCSLYFTWICRQSTGSALEQWRQIKDAASAAIIDGGGTITHHHAVGTDHRQHLAEEIGDRGVAVLRAVKAELDPLGVMNPGKLMAQDPSR